MNREPACRKPVLNRGMSVEEQIAAQVGSPRQKITRSELRRRTFKRWAWFMFHPRVLALAMAMAIVLTLLVMGALAAVDRPEEGVKTLAAMCFMPFGGWLVLAGHAWGEHKWQEIDGMEVVDGDEEGHDER